MCVLPHFVGGVGCFAETGANGRDNKCVFYHILLGGALPACLPAACLQFICCFFTVGFI